MPYEDFKDLPKRMASGNYHVIKHSRLLNIQELMFIKDDFFDGLPVAWYKP